MEESNKREFTILWQVLSTNGIHKKYIIKGCALIANNQSCCSDSSHACLTVYNSDQKKKKKKDYRSAIKTDSEKSKPLCLKKCM